MKKETSVLLSALLIGMIAFSPASHARKAKKHRSHRHKIQTSAFAYTPVRTLSEEEAQNVVLTREEIRHQREQKLRNMEQALNRKEMELRREMQEQALDKKLDQYEETLSQRDDQLAALEKKITPQTYSARMGWKALDGFANINTAILEVPKSIIEVTNESNVFFGLVGGGFKGMLNAFGRFATGVSDLVTFPIVTRQTITPGHVWEDFDAETSYGEIMRLDNAPTTRFEKMDKCDVIGPAC